MSVHIYVGEDAQTKAHACVAFNAKAKIVSIKGQIMQMATLLGMNKTSVFSEDFLRETGHHPALAIVDQNLAPIKVIYDVPDALTLQLLKNAFNAVVKGEVPADFDTEVVGAEVTLAHVAKFARMIGNLYHETLFTKLTLFGLRYTKHVVFSLVVTEPLQQIPKLEAQIVMLKQELAKEKAKNKVLSQEKTKDTAASIDNLIKNAKASV